MADRLTRISEALAKVAEERKLCPFHPSHRGRTVPAVGEACKKCGQQSNGDGGLCVIHRAALAAVLAIEEAVA